MTLEQILEAERASARAVHSLRPWATDADIRASLDRMAFVMQEVRQFAVMWNDIREREDVKQVTPHAAITERQEAIMRLTNCVAPQRI